MWDSDSTINISQAGINVPESNDKAILSEENLKMVAYIDLLGTSKWFLKNEGTEDFNEKIRKRFGDYLMYLWHKQEPEVKRLSLHPVGDGALIIPKKKPSDPSIKPMDLSNFMTWLCDLWYYLVNKEYPLKILISSMDYQSVMYKKNNFNPDVDWYPNLVFAGGLSAVKFNQIDKSLHVPSGIYTNLANFNSNKLCDINSVKNDNWFSIKIWEYFDNSFKPKIQSLMKNMSNQYSAIREAKSKSNDEGIENSKTIINSLD